MTQVPCPVCGRPSRSVSPLTLQNHVPKVFRDVLGGVAAYCLNGACRVVYFNPQGFTVSVGQTTRPVTLKEKGGHVPVCYCFGFTRGDVAKGLSCGAESGISARIREGIKEGRCDCERQNPQGTCCLANVDAVIAEIRGP